MTAACGGFVYFSILFFSNTNKSITLYEDVVVYKQRKNITKLRYTDIKEIKGYGVVEGRGLVKSHWSIEFISKSGLSIFISNEYKDYIVAWEMVIQKIQKANPDVLIDEKIFQRIEWLENHKK